MIPKIIHYCWFGENPLPKSVQKCIRSWKKYCPDYKIIQWNENNFDINQNIYMSQAYKSKKWAFVTDVARLLIMWEYGGIYMDTDVELIKPLDPYLQWEGYFGMEGTKVATGLGFAAAPKNPMVKALLDSYNNVPFIKEDGSFDLEACTYKSTRELCKLGYVENGQEQVIDGVHFLPGEYLCPIDYVTGEKHITAKTISIHHYAMSWLSQKEQHYFQYQWFVHALKRHPAGRKLIQLKKLLFK